MKYFLLILFVILLQGCRTKELFLMTADSTSIVLEKEVVGTSIASTMIIEDKNDATWFLQKMDKNWSIGNACNEEPIELWLEKELDFNSHRLELMNVSLHLGTNKGFKNKNDNSIKWNCPNAMVWFSTFITKQ